MLTSDRPGWASALLTDLGLMQQSSPRYWRCAACSRTRRYHHKDVFEHTVQVVDQTPPRAWSLRWAALLHDIAKPRTRTIEDGEVHFYGHEHLGEQMARKILRGCGSTGRPSSRSASWWRCTSAPMPTRTTGRTARCAASSARPTTCWRTCSTCRRPT